MATNGQENAADGAARALSRALYRRLKHSLADGADPRTHHGVLDACETTMRRLITEPDFARPADFLFEELRFYFPLDEQRWVRMTVDRHIELAKPFVDRLPRPTRECNAFSRGGAPCRREARPGSEFCPSHRHLELMDGPGDING